jgi:hypothetical protein
MLSPIAAAYTYDLYIDNTSQSNNVILSSVSIAVTLFLAVPIVAFLYFYRADAHSLLPFVSASITLPQPRPHQHPSNSPPH